MAFFWWLGRRKTIPARPPQGWMATGTLPASQETLPQRRYLPGADYLLPKDEDERARLEFQHHALSLTLGNHYLAPLPPVVRSIVDVGAGTGIWPIEMARLFPDSLVLGLDVDTALFHPTPPEHCLLRQGDILCGLPLPDQFAEFVHQRFLVLAIPDTRWPGVVRELVRVTRVGGWLELVETDARVQNGGAATEQMMAWVDLVRQARGIMGEPVKRLGDLLRREGVRDIETQSIPLKVGPWGGRAGTMMERDILAAIQALKAPCCTQGVAASAFDACLQNMAAEWKQGQASCTIYVAYGKRAVE